MSEEEIKEKAEEFARINRNKIAKELTDKLKYAPENDPISVFMAGSPGAGKTEFSKRLIINRSLEKRRFVTVFYVYQKPEVAWKFTQAREMMEGRHIPKSVFIDQFINSRETIELIHENFTGKVLIYLVKKNFETHAVEKIINISATKDKIDQHLEERYNREDIEKMI